MAGPLFDLLPDGDAGPDELLGRFLDYVDSLGLTLYPAQEDAVLALFEGKNVILNTPDRLGEVSGRLGPSFRLARPRTAVPFTPAPSRRS